MQAYGYAIQAAFYLFCMRLAGFKANQFIFVNVEKSGAHAVSVNALSPEYLAWGRAEMLLTLKKIAKANKAQRWDTGWSDQVNIIDLPRWLQPVTEF